MIYNKDEIIIIKRNVFFFFINVGPSMKSWTKYGPRGLKGYQPLLQTNSQIIKRNRYQFSLLW